MDHFIYRRTRFGESFRNCDPLKGHQDKWSDWQQGNICFDFPGNDALPRNMVEDDMIEYKSWIDRGVMDFSPYLSQGGNKEQACTCAPA